MSKRGQSISINTIIIAALGLAVLVVLFYIFTARISTVPRTLNEVDTCVQKCAGLNMNPGNHPSQDTKSCVEGQYVGGSYGDGKFGCCCLPKT